MINEYSLICRTKETTEVSLASILNLSCNKLKQLLSIDYEKLYEAIPSHEMDFSEYLYHEFLINNQITVHALSSIHWFHGTRCLRGTNFMNEGILPLNQVKKRLLKQIDHLAKINRIPSTNTDSCHMAHYFFLFVEKTEHSIHWGPYAMLVKDALIMPEQYDCHDYLEIPEIVEDYIGVKYPLHFNLLRDIYKKETNPCIVEFLDAINKSSSRYN